MPQQQLILTIGRIERALSRLERIPSGVRSGGSDSDLLERHEKLKAETRAAIGAIEDILSGRTS
jgi:hypothetical protein